MSDGAVKQPEAEAALERRASELGIDLGLLDDNLALSPLERMRQHDRAVRRILAARKRLGIRENDES